MGLRASLCPIISEKISRANEPRLTYLRDNGDGTFSARGITFNLQQVSVSEGLRARVAQSLDAGFVAAANSPGGAMHDVIVTLSTLAARTPGGQVVTFYSDPAAFYSGTPMNAQLYNTHPTLGVQGMAAWVDHPANGAPIQNGNIGLVENRTDLRIFINPLGGSRAIPLEDGTIGLNFRDLPRLVWHELGGHATSTLHHGNTGQPPPTETSDPWIQKIQRMGQEFAPVLFDPRTQQIIELISPTEWSLADTVTTFASDNSSQTGDIYSFSGALDIRTVVFSDNRKEITDFDETNKSTWSTNQQTFDTFGRLDIQTTINDNGTRVVTDYDQTSTQPWSQFVRAYDAQGRLDHETSTLDTGRRFLRDWDQDGSQSWTRIDTDMDAQGRADFQVIYHDAGGYTARDWDLLQQYVWWVKTIVYDPAGRQDYASDTNDDATAFAIDYDLTSTQPWAQYVVAYDSRGRVDWTSEYRDDGRRIDTNFDQDGSQAWTSVSTQSDAQGRPDYQTVRWDTGRVTAQDWDLLGSQPWYLKTVELDALGRTDTSREMWRDGSRLDYDLDQDSALPWLQMLIRTDAQGRTDWTQELRDDNTRAEMDYDQAGQFAWSSVKVVYDAADRTDWTQEYRDDGTHIDVDYDQAGQFGWSSKTQLYDAANRWDWTQEYRDDGTHADTDYDQTGAFDWWSHTQTFDSAGRLDTDIGYYDSGPFAGGRYERDYDQLNNDMFNYLGRAPGAQDVTYIFDARNAWVARQVHWDDGFYTDRRNDVYGKYSYQWYSNTFNASGKLVGFKGIDDDGYAITLVGGSDQGYASIRLTFPVDFG